MKQPRSYYWDSSVFITVLAKQTCYGEETLDAATEILRRVTIGEAIIVSSTIVVTEVLPGYCSPEQYDQFLATLQSPYLVLRGADIAVARKAAELRQTCHEHKEKLRLATPDALHIATYLMYENGIDRIHSYDPHFPSKFKWLNLGTSPVYPFQDQTAMVFTDENAQRGTPLGPDDAGGFESLAGSDLDADPILEEEAQEAEPDGIKEAGDGNTQLA